MERTKAADPTGAGVGYRMLKGVLCRDREFVGLGDADLLLVAVRRLDARRDGTIEVVQNPDPRWGCCATYEVVVPDQAGAPADHEHDQNGNGLVADALERLHAEERPNAKTRPVVLAAAIEWLGPYLAEGPTPSRQVVAEARARGFSAMTIGRARGYLKCETYQRGQRWWVALPEATVEESSPAS